MSWRALLVVFLLGCSGNSGSSTLPVCPDCSTCPDCPTCPVCEVSTTPVLVGGPGFWCSERRSVRQDITKPIAECHRTQSSCELLREKAKKEGRYYTDCRPAEKGASCFSMTDIRRHGIGFRCFETEADCEAEWPGYRKVHPSAVQMTKCEWTAASESTGEPGPGRAGDRALARSVSLEL